VARGTKGRPESTGVHGACGAVKLSSLCQGLFFDNCLAGLSDLLEDVISKQNIFSPYSHSRGEREESQLKFNFS